MSYQLVFRTVTSPKVVEEVAVPSLQSQPLLADNTGVTAPPVVYKDKDSVGD